ncbi:hypothetical protein OAG71_01240 [bacterium]|nr:hypothetical protein [bacterium]
MRFPSVIAFTPEPSLIQHTPQVNLPANNFNGLTPSKKINFCAVLFAALVRTS